MEEIIENLTWSKQRYLDDIDRMQRDLDRDLEHIEKVEERISETRESIRRAKSFIADYDTAVAVLQAQEER